MRHVTIQAPLAGKTFIIQLETWSTEATNSIAKEYKESVEHLEHGICSEPLFSKFKICPFKPETGFLVRAVCMNMKVFTLL